MVELEFQCRPYLKDASGWWDDEFGVADWIEIVCEEHEERFHCGHRHRRWGPTIRCMTRHVMDHADVT